MPGKRVRRIGVFSCANAIYCSFYVKQKPSTKSVSVPSLRLIRSYWCEVKPEKYEHMAELLNKAARKGNGSIEAHTAICGFIWTRSQ